VNRGFCGTCSRLVTATKEEREGKVYLVKECPECGRTEELISSDSGRYFIKHELDGKHEEPAGCMLNCLTCKRKNQPSFIFVDITNRCNSNCPICINNTPSMGFLFDPPMEYFEKIFAYFSELRPRPAVQLFGGEPTVRKDLFDIIALARSYHLPTRVVTNGLKLADGDFCRRLIDTGATILFAYDGANPRTYEILRGNKGHLQIKQQAMENIARIGGAKVALMTCVAKGFNDTEMGGILEFCHERRDFIRGIYFLPLAQTWSLEDFNVEPERITTEDMEILLNSAFPDERVDFVPAGVLGELKSLMRCLRAKRPPFAGAHPNCESMYLLASDGEKYVPLGRYLRQGLPDLIHGLFEVDARLGKLEGKMEGSLRGRLLSKLGLKGRWLRMRAVLALTGAARRNVRLGTLLKGRGPGKLYHAVAALAGLAVGRSARKVLRKHTKWQGVLQIIVLPFEDEATLETERLERCPNAFVYYDPEADQVGYVPTCAWSQHKIGVMRRITDFYSAAAPSSPSSSAR